MCFDAWKKNRSSNTPIGDFFFLFFFFLLRKTGKKSRKGKTDQTLDVHTLHSHLKMQFSFWKTCFICKIPTLHYRTVVHACLFILRKNVVLHGLIWFYMIINFANYLFKTANFGYFRHFLTKNSACMILLDPTCLFEIAISSTYMLIPSCTTIR